MSCHVQNALGAVFMTLAGWIFAEIYFRNKPESFYSFRDEEAREAVEEAGNLDDDADLPGTLASLLPLVVPIVLILLNTTCSMMPDRLYLLHQPVVHLVRC